MSAFIVSKQHIDAICSAALTYPKWGIHWCVEDEPWKQLRRGDEPSRVGQMLWHTNVASVATRYDDCAPGKWPGPTGLTLDTVLAYRYQPPRSVPTVVEALKLLDCYEYQSCEHEEWESSEARNFVESLRRALIKELPGYDHAAWDWQEAKPKRRT